jgi:UrcA family protein
MTMSTQTLNRLGTMTLAGLFLLASQTAFSQQNVNTRDRDVVSATIDLRDVDLSTVQGSRWAYRKIVSAAKTVCFGGIRRRAGVQSFSVQTAAARRCFDDAVNATLARVEGATGVDIEQLAALDRYETAVVSR